MTQSSTPIEHMARDVMSYDVVIVGAGPAGLAAAIRIKQYALEKGADISVAVLEKGAEVGAHLLSGAVFDPRALTELLPNWAGEGAPLSTAVRDDRFVFLTQEKSWRLPTPPTMKNHGCFIISLGELAKWLGAQAEAMGVEIFPGFAAAEILYNAEGHVIGVATGDMGIGKDGQPTSNHVRGVALHAKQTLFAEGCRGSLTKQLFARFRLRDGVDPQTYGLGIKEVWEIDPTKHHEGLVQHTVGWPMDSKTYGGSWLYHGGKNLVSIGFVIGLDYANPYLSPFEEFQRFKQHPAIRSMLEGGKRMSYGARALSEGGLQSIPQLHFPGGLLIGDAAGFLNVARIKGNHTAMKSGMVAAEAVVDHLVATPDKPTITDYRDRLEKTWLWKELWSVRNVRPAFRWGLWPAMLYAVIDAVLLGGRTPWTLHHRHEDHEGLKPSKFYLPIAYPKPDGVISFDRLSSVYLSNTNHEENQPPHLHLRVPERAVETNYILYAAPETRFCPAGVYEYIVSESGDKPRLQINAQNCVHCKTCDIKDPTQNIDWVVPEGGGGPNYQGM